MPENKKMSDDEIRRLAKREISEREKLRAQERSDSQQRTSDKDDIDRKKKIIEEERRKYYESNPDYQEYISETGEIEWLTKEEIREREGLFDDEMEELESGKKRAQFLLISMLALFICTVLVIYVLLSEKTGSIQVISSVKGASIYLDSSPAELKTDAIFIDIPVGKHVVSVEMPGYKIVGDPSQQVNLSANEREIVIFVLEEDTEAQVETEDKVKTMFSNGSGKDSQRRTSNP
jgi:hypothetical protein